MLSAKQEVEQIVSLLKLQPGVSICDLCCGPGRHSLELGRLGYHVTGVDRTGLYIEEAKKKTDEQGVNIRFVQEDMRRFCEPEAFDAVINVLTSFGYFEDAADDKRVLENVYKSLKGGGKLLIDMMGKEVLARIFQEKRWREEDGLIILEEAKASEDWGRIDSRWIIISGERREECRFSLRIYSADELSELLKSCGFEQVEIYGDLSGTPYDDDAQRLVIVAQK
ncbi:MAG: methyltransferase domain-containing protein [Phycisphaerae bacterium]|nr:class I SAM-dependent methyltransferase [Phycisphaerae bacterium]NIR63907.1 class I SAM-dependent methyltransferase [candidate division Zixibacteria bacterium]NIP55221.1 class I SAM-dependent methyltransferase [Phycisphaerae bacterium]NIS50212.1 class I SAM-dependent methyltransferase [Phycisphaerae bacterium]NIU07848.1 class I SAM-dependent methyltransferase [Phycisphaerae bacterium]